MREVESAREGRRRLRAAALALAALMLAWTMLPGSEGGEAGAVRIAGAIPPPSAIPAASPPPAAPLTPRGNAEQAEADHYLVLREARDTGWADRSEAALRAFLRGLAYVDARTLTVRCAATLCEATGLATEDPASGSMAPVWEAFTRDSDGATLRGQGLARAAIVFGTGRVREEYVIHYRRAETQGWH